MKTNVKIRNRIVSAGIALAMVLSIFCITMQPISAASKEKTYSTNGLYNSIFMKDKNGAYYIWAEPGFDGGQTIKCSKSLKGKAKVLAKSKKKQDIIQTAVTNGETIYYAILDRSAKTKKTIFYKTTVNKKTPTKIKTVQGLCVPTTYYKGNLYYVNSKEKKLYACDVTKKKTKLVAKNFKLEADTSTSISGNGKYMIRGEWGSELNEYGQIQKTEYLYDVAAKKETLLSGVSEGTVYGKNIYYSTTKGSKSTIKKCDLSGKNSKTIKTVTCDSGVYVGRKAAWFYDSKGNLKKLTYQTKKVTTVNWQ